MAKGHVVAGIHPSQRFDQAKRDQAKSLRDKGKNRTKAESDDLINLMAERIDALEAKLKLEQH